MPNGGNLIISTTESPGNVEIIIQDNGQGIPEDNLDKLFTPFFTTKKIGQGTGLGLALVYSLVKIHKGQIIVKSNADPAKGLTGTTFNITLPRNSKFKKQTNE
jgi:signal transduction histidine kinase